MRAPTLTVTLSLAATRSTARSMVTRRWGWTRTAPSAARAEPAAARRSPAEAPAAIDEPLCDRSTRRVSPVGAGDGRSATGNRFDWRHGLDPPPAVAWRLPRGAGGRHAVPAQWDRRHCAGYSVARRAGPPVSIAAMLAALFTAGTLAGLILSLTVGLFGVHESLQTPLVPATLIIESTGVLVLVVTVILAHKHQRTSA